MTEIKKGKEQKDSFELGKSKLSQNYIVSEQKNGNKAKTRKIKIKKFAFTLGPTSKNTYILKFTSF